MNTLKKLAAGVVVVIGVLVMATIVQNLVNFKISDVMAAVVCAMLGNAIYQETAAKIDAESTK